MAPRGKSPMGRTALPATVMNVKLCCAKCEEKAKEECEEVEGVVQVVTNQSENKVIVYGPADPPALLKKMRRHLDKHAMYWPMDESNQAQVAPPLIPVDPRELHSQNRGNLERNAGGPPLQTGTVLPVDPRDGRPLVDSREVRQVERELKDAEVRQMERELKDAEVRQVERELKGAHKIPREVVMPEGAPREVVFVPVDAKDGTAIDPRTVRKVEPAARPRDGRPAQVVDARDLVRPVERMELRGEHPRDPNHGAPGPGPREVVFIPVDARDGTPVDPRRVHQVDPRDGRPLDPPRVDAAGRPITPPHARPPGLGPELREVRPVHDSPVELREVRPIDLREPGRPVDASDLRPIDPHNMMRHGDPREVQRMDPHVVMRTSEPLDHRDDLRSVDPRMVRQIDPRDGRRALDPRDMDGLRDGRATAAAFGPSEPPPRGGAMRGGVVPEGLGPVRTGRDSREVLFAPPSRSSNLSPTHGPRDMRPRSPPEAEYMSRSPRQQAPDYGPRSPRGEYGPPSPRGYSGAAGYGPPSPRFEAAPNYSGPRSPRGRAGEYDPVRQRPPVLDRELSFNEFGPGPDFQGASAMDQVRSTGGVVPLPYEPVDPRDAAAFDFHGGGGGPAPHPRSPRSGGPDPTPPVRGYGDIDPRQFRQPASEPRGLRDATHELEGGNAGIRYNDGRDYINDSRDYMNDPAVRDRDEALHYRRGGMERSPRRRSPQHASQYSEFRNGEADGPRDYQPKESYFSDYHPSQNYQAGPLATQDIDELPVTNPNYKKHLGVSQF